MITENMECEAWVDWGIKCGDSAVAKVQGTDRQYWLCSYHLLQMNEPVILEWAEYA